jgi:polygalacturonase
MQGGKGYVRGILFERLNMTAVQYPIIIDQFYCPQGNCPKKVTTHTKTCHYADYSHLSFLKHKLMHACTWLCLQDGGVAISDARFINIQGTSTEQQAIRLLCSQSVNCRDLYLRNIDLTWMNHSAPASATILNAHGTTAGILVPQILFWHVCTS